MSRDFHGENGEYCGREEKIRTDAFPA